MPKRDIRIGEVVLRRQPPVVGVWCMPPSSRNADAAACVHPSELCEGPTETCLLCGFTFCALHSPKHKRRFECPVDIWLEFDERRKAWYSLVKEDPNARPRVNVRFPEAPEASDG